MSRTPHGIQVFSKTKLITLFCVLVTCNAAVNKVLAKSLLLLSDNAPPHMIAQQNAGIDIDITRDVLSALGHQTEIKFTPLTRSMVEVAQHRADLFLPTFFQSDTDELYFSDAIINYRPTVFSLAEDNFSFENIAALRNKNIITFQGATGYFGEAFKDVAANSPYRELPDMSKFPTLLLAKRSHVVVLDYYIFYYFLRQTAKSDSEYRALVSQINSHDLIPQVNAHVGFNDQKLRDDFNQALREYKAQNKHQYVIQKYIGEIIEN